MQSDALLAIKYWTRACDFDQKGKYGENWRQTQSKKTSNYDVEGSLCNFLSACEPGRGDMDERETCHGLSMDPGAGNIRKRWGKNHSNIPCCQLPTQSTKVAGMEVNAGRDRNCIYLGSDDCRNNRVKIILNPSYGHGKLLG